MMLDGLACIFKDQAFTKAFLSEGGLRVVKMWLEASSDESQSSLDIKNTLASALSQVLLFPTIF
jgi:hypothetical protein